MRRIVLFAGALVWALLYCGRAIGASAPVVLRGHVARRLQTATRLSRASASETVRLSLVAGVDPLELDRELEEIYASPAGKRKFLAPGEFARRFGLAAKREKLKEFARANGLEVDASSDQADSLVVRVGGTAAAVEKAFGVTLHRYRLPDGREFRANDADPSVPAALAPHLSAVLGLSNLPGVARPHFRAAPASRRLGPLASPAGFGGAAPAALTGGTGPQGGLAPLDIKTVYGLTGAQTGAGQTVAILTLDGYSAADIASYETQFSLPATPVTFVSVDGTPNLCGAHMDQPCNAGTLASDGGMVEPALDIEMMIAMAPSVTQILVYGSSNTLSNILDIYAKIAADDSAPVVSTSWGVDEQDAGNAFLDAEGAIFQQMAMQGQAVFAAAGDHGPYDQGGNSTLAVDDPASQPYVTAVGGTSLTGTLAVHAEAVWNNGYDALSGFYDGGGGGVSVHWPLPNYQFALPGATSGSLRNVPDVALNADPVSSPYSICVGGNCNCCNNPCNPTGCTTLVGGTSAAAPLWAGLAALVNQQRAAGGSTALGFANPALYSLGVASPTVYNDVFSGNNGVFSANAGYDNATGWGSFRADNMISACSGLVVSTTVVASTGATTTISLLGLSGSITVTIPPGAFPLTETVTAAVPSVTPPPSAGASGRVTPLGPAVDITLSRPIAQFLKPVTLQMQLAATGVDPKLIKLAWWDQGQAIWWPELQASYDPLAGTVTGQIWHNTIHAAVAVQAAADLNKVKVFPDPIDFATAVRGTVKFMGMTPNATIRVYNLAGERVVTIPPGAANGATVNDGASGTAEWDGRNSYGSPVARGTYVYVIKDDNGKETRGKFAVVR